MTEQLLAGFHAVLAALRHDPSNLGALWIDTQRRDRRMQELLALAERQGVTVRPVERHELDRLSPKNTRHQGVLAEYSGIQQRFNERDLPRLLDASATPLLLVLDGVQDPHNLGACLRSAAAAGVSAVIVPSDRAAGLTPTVSKVASGAAEVVPLIPVSNLARALRELKHRGLWLVGAAADAEQSLYAADLRPACALVLGAEGAGLRRLTAELCDNLVSIPMAAGPVASLNVSVAAGVMLFEAVRQRHA